MIELNAPTLIAADILMPNREADVPVESSTSSDPRAEDFSALLTEMTGPAEELPEDEREPAGSRDETSVAETTPPGQADVPSQAVPGGASAAPDAGGESKPVKPVSDHAAAGLHSMMQELQEPSATPEIEKAWADVKKFEFTVQDEAAQPVEPRPQARNAGAERPKQAMITTDPIANTQQQELPPRVIAILRGAIETRVPDRGKPNTAAPTLTETTAAPTTPFTEVAGPAGGRVEQVLSAHHVEIPNVPHVQIVRTVAMEVGDADSQVVIHIRERGGDVSLQLKTASELIHQNLQSSLGTLVRALKQEQVQISSVEVSRKPMIDKVRRMKEAH